MIYSLVAPIVFASLASASPAQTGSVSVASDDASLPFFFPESSFEQVNVASFAAVETQEQNVAVGLTYLAGKLSLDSEEIRVTSVHKDNAGVHHVYAVRVLGGVDVDNQVAAVHLKNGDILSWSSSFQASNSFAAARPLASIQVSQEQAIEAAKAASGLEFHSEVPVKNAWTQQADGSLAYTYVIQVKNEAGSKWLQLNIDAASGKVVQSVNFVSKASFDVVAWPNISPNDGFSTVVDPDFKGSSPNGWNDDGSKQYTTTQGNNVKVGLKSATGPQAASTGNLVFSSKFDPKTAPTTADNSRAAEINLFYVANKMHDISYQYGFTETAGNFQANNFGKGGKQGDAVSVTAQSNQGTDNAYFSTPPDGQSGSMVMFLFTATNPGRDGALDNDVPMHEYTHGISNRMTGGSATGQCLQTTAAGGMGEGWSDTLAMYLLRKPTETRKDDFVMGAYVEGNTGGIRSYPYSTSLTTNPLTYNSLGGRYEVHAIGEFWAVTLNELYWNLVDKYGYSANWYDATQQKGNIIALQLVIGGFALQPCNPNFLQARDAILAADKQYYNSANLCEIWKAFATRGLGMNATKSYVNDIAIPAQCMNKTVRRR